MKRKTRSKPKEITHTSHVRVRFVETDPLGIVWHGNYIQYFEDGREDFGRHHGISYLDQKEYGFATPIVKSSTDHKRPLRYGDIATIKTIYMDSPAAKMVFRYEI
ncbi:MAG: acyl-CoA thioesterase, partial [Xanthomarina sp.]